MSRRKYHSYVVTLDGDDKSVLRVLRLLLRRLLRDGNVRCKAIRRVDEPKVGT